MLTKRFVIGGLLRVVVAHMALQGSLGDRHVTTDVTLELFHSLVTHFMVSQGSGVRQLLATDGAADSSLVHGMGVERQHPLGNESPVTIQVWSLTQFYSVDFSKSRIVVKKCVFNKRTIKVCVRCC